jgi:transposase
MLTVHPSVVVRFALEPQDFRKSIDGLAIAVGHALGRDPMCGELFLFCNRTRTALKALYWTNNGFVLVYKRLERHRFDLPQTTEGTTELTLPPALLCELLSGLTRQCRSHVLDAPTDTIPR